MAYKLEAADSLTDTALALRKLITEAFEKSEEIQWPPSAAYIYSLKGIVSKDLEMLLKIVISGKTDCANTKANRIVLSIVYRRRPV